ncbi:MAG: DUF1501 domain-containing protein [Bdellovibrionales bacterium]|nr:DUF1501 domain-containing protein [Bdellovibrionales bacterium]
MDRRRFLRNSIASATAASVGGLIPRLALADYNPAQNFQGGATNVYCKIRAQGGWDTYYAFPTRAGHVLHSTLESERPTLFIDPSNTIPVVNGGDSFHRALHPDWQPIRDRNVPMALVENVGLIEGSQINTNRSHQIATDFYERGSHLNNSTDARGPLGRALDTSGKAFGIGTNTEMVARKGFITNQNASRPLVIGSLGRFGFQNISYRFDDINACETGSSGNCVSRYWEDNELKAEKLRELVGDLNLSNRPIMRNLFDAFGRTEGAVQKMQSYAAIALSGDYGPGSYFTDQCRDAARLIIGAMNDTDFAGTPIVVCLDKGGFDTHEGQGEVDNLPAKIRDFAHGIAGMYHELQLRGVSNRALFAIVSEFGRQIVENSGYGTDHGIALDIPVFGDRVAPQVVESPPSLATREGNAVLPTQSFQRVESAIMQTVGLPESIAYPNHAPISGLLV